MIIPQFLWVKNLAAVQLGVSDIGSLTRLQSRYPGPCLGLQSSQGLTGARIHVSVLCCCVTNFSKFSSLKNLFIISQFYRSEVYTWLTQTLCSVSHRAIIRVSARPCSNLEAYLGSNPSSVRLMAELSPWSCRTEVLIFFLAVDQELLSAPTGHLQFSSKWSLTTQL